MFLLLTVMAAAAAAAHAGRGTVVGECQGLPATIVGTRSADHLVGTRGRDVIDGLGGNDVIEGGGGNDVICGGIGNDLLAGGGNSGDRIYGGRGSDTCTRNGGKGRLVSCEHVVTRAATEPPGFTGRSDAQAAALLRPRKREPIAANSLANHTIPSGSVPWSLNKSQTQWRRWIAKRNRVTGRFTGRTDEILQWAAYKWGIDEGVLRAVAAQESRWRQDLVGDDGASFGIMQVRDHYSNGSLDFGGFPWTQRSTALNVDFYGAWLRTCLNGDFYDGGPWLYGGRRIRGDLWGCVGAWYSGDWYGSDALSYITQVKAKLEQRPWLAW